MPRLLSMGTAAGTAGLGGFLVNVRVCRLLQRLGDEAVIFAQPATEVDQSEPILEEDI